MSHFSSAMIKLRNTEAQEAILSSWSDRQGKEKYFIHCPCTRTCPCITEEQKVTLENCLFVGELDKLFVEQPFVRSHGFLVAWHCDVCKNELSCGMPVQG